MPALDLEGLTENSPLAEIRDYIERHGLDVATNVGGRERRTKAQMFKDLKDAVSKASGSSSSTPLSPLSCNEKVVLSLKDRQRVGFRTHLDACVKSLGKDSDASIALQNLLKASVSGDEIRMNARPKDFAIDEPSSRGLAHLLGVSTVELCKCMSRGRAAIEDEIDMHGTEEDKECLAYVLNKGGVLAGESPKTFPNGVRDKGRKPLRFEDFCEMDEAKRVGLEQEEVLALRLYTTAAFKSLNHKLRLRDEAAYPFPATIGFLHSGIKKLRENNKDDVASRDLFRGMRDLQLDFKDDFMRKIVDEPPHDVVFAGGTERAPMSTTTSFHVAIQYGASSNALIFKVKTDNFRQRGANIGFLSAFPTEEECLFPPGTFLQPTGIVDEVTLTLPGKKEGARFTVIEVKPDID